MSQEQSGGGNGGFMIILFFLLFIIGVIVGGPENIQTILLLAVIIGVTIGLVFVIKSTAKILAQTKQEKHKNLAIANSTETMPELMSIPSSSQFANKEEEHVNMSFREFLRKNNEVILAQAHDNYLCNKANALRALGRNDEAALLDIAISQARYALSSAQSNCGETFESKYCNFFYRSTEVKNAFTAFASRLPNDRLPLIGDFFQSPQIKAVKLDPTSVLLFMPAYVMHYSGPSQNIKLIQYNDVSVSSWITTKILDDQRQPNDEIEHIGYLYETKDGNRDMRYSWENNPSFTYVYRGIATIRCNGLSYEQKFSNKSLTVGFEKAFGTYLSLLAGKYKNSICQILSHNENFLSAGDIDTFIVQQEAADRNKVVAKKFEREKQDKARIEREAKAADRPKIEKSEKTATSREKQRKADFLKNSTIIDGTLTSWYGSDRNFVLPEGLATSIGTAFRWKSSLESVELPNGITSIQANAFYGSTSLRRIIIPASVTEIGKEAFFGCTELNEITLSNMLMTITSQMFGKCSSLKALTIPAGVQKIERAAFSGCSNLQELILPEGITVVDDDAFENCIALRSVVLPNSLQKIGNGIFRGCTSLEHAVLGNGIKRIPDGCFNNLQNLIDVTIAPDVVEFGDRAFLNCHKLKQVLFVDTKQSTALSGTDFESLVSGTSIDDQKSFTLDALERIGESAFENCFVFDGLYLKYRLRVIGDFAFANCRAMRTISLPKSIAVFGVGVFSGCIELLSIAGVENIDWHKKYSFIGTPWLSSQAENGFVIFDGYLEAYTGSDSSVRIPHEVKTIGRNSFDGNSFITNIIVPDGVISIDEMAFANCRKLKSILIADSVTHIKDNAFANNSSFVIQCSRGSAASSFRIRNKIPGEYVAKSKSVVRSDRTVNRRTSLSLSDGLSSLSEDELRAIMEMRRDKFVQKISKVEKPAELEKIEYVLVPFDETNVSVKLQDDNRKITNNIFYLRFIQSEPVNSETAFTEFETFVIDSHGQIISNINLFSADKSGDDLTHKIAFVLSAQERFDKSSSYYVVLRYKGVGTSILSKTQYQINIEFTSDFDF